MSKEAKEEKKGQEAGSTERMVEERMKIDSKGEVLEEKRGKGSDEGKKKELEAKTARSMDERQKCRRKKDISNSNSLMSESVNAA